MSKPVKIGSWGGAGGQPRDVKHTPSKLVRVEVSSGDAIDSIKFTYSDNAGNLHEDEWGGPGGDIGEFHLRGSDYVKEISGTYGPYYNVPSVVKSLKFVTNRGATYKYGTAGTGGSFHVPVVNAQITGFFVRTGDLIDAIGIYVAPA